MSQIPQQFIDSSTRFQRECSARVDEMIAANDPVEAEKKRMQGMLIGTLVGGSALCLSGVGILMLTQAIK